MVFTRCGHPLCPRALVRVPGQGAARGCHAQAQRAQTHCHRYTSTHTACRDPFSTIFGVSNQHGSALVDAFDLFSTETDLKRRERYTRLYRLLLVINSFDVELLQTQVRGLARGVYVDAAKATDELDMLATFCGPDDKFALLTLVRDANFTFGTLVKTPPWRQLYGEICYFVAQCHDTPKLSITCTRKGFFVSKGYTANDKGAEILDYDALSQVYPSLVDLFRAQSPHFASRIDNQAFTYHNRNDGIDTYCAATAAETNEGSLERALGDDGHATDASDDGRRKDAKDHRSAYRVVSARKTKAASKPHASAEPSMKWKALGLSTPPQPPQQLKLRSSASPKKPPVTRQRNPTKPHLFAHVDLNESNTDLSSDDETVEKRPESSELCIEYYPIQKLVKYLRSGTQTATIIAICALRDLDLSLEANQMAIRDVGGLEVILNLLHTNDTKCRVGALKILKEISTNSVIRAAIAGLDGIPPLVLLLDDENGTELQCLAAETIAFCARNARNRRSVRGNGGIKKLVKLLQVQHAGDSEAIAVSGALALQSCSKSAKNKEAIRAAGAVFLLAKLLTSKSERLLIPVVGILQECASEEKYRVDIREAGMVKFLVDNLSSKNHELQTHSASCIFKCASEDATRVLVNKYNGLAPLVSLLDLGASKELLVAATGAIWKCAQNGI